MNKNCGIEQMWGNRKSKVNHSVYWTAATHKLTLGHHFCTYPLMCPGSDRSDLLSISKSLCSVGMHGAVSVVSAVPVPVTWIWHKEWIKC